MCLPHSLREPPPPGRWLRGLAHFPVHQKDNMGSILSRGECEGQTIDVSITSVSLSSSLSERDERVLGRGLKQRLIFTKPSLSLAIFLKS